MGFRLIVSERAEMHIDSIIDYVVNELNNPGAAKAILSDIEEAYDKLEYMADSLGFCADYLSGRKRISQNNSFIT